MWEDSSFEQISSFIAHCSFIVPESVNLDAQVKLLRAMLGEDAPECPKIDISMDVWEHMILGSHQDKGEKLGMGYATFNPYNDDVSFMTGKLS